MSNVTVRSAGGELTLFVDPHRHDVHTMLIGPAVLDIAAYFVDRNNFLKVRSLEAAPVGAER